MIVNRLICGALLASLVLAAGCGGGSDGGGTGGNPTRANIQGIWTGSATPNGSAQANMLEVEYVQNGASVTGTSRLTENGTVYIGTVNGTIVGNNLNATVDYGALGTSTSMLTAGAASLTGTYVLKLNGAVVATGAISLSKSNVTTTVNAQGSYGGTSINDAPGSTAKPFRFTIMQVGDAITLMGASNTTIAFTGSGSIIGTRITAHLIHTGSTDYTDIAGTISGSAGSYTIVGTTFEPATNSANNGIAVTGTFSVSELLQP